jgi:hypothetical protein
MLLLMLYCCPNEGIATILLNMLRFVVSTLLTHPVQAKLAVFVELFGREAGSPLLSGVI